MVVNKILSQNCQKVNDSPGLVKYEMVLGPSDATMPDSSVPSIWENVLVPSPQREGTSRKVKMVDPKVNK